MISYRLLSKTFLSAFLFFLSFTLCSHVGAQDGKTLFQTNCAACHQANGKGIPNVFVGLDGSPVATGPKQAHIDIVMNGKTGTAMQAFGKQLSDTDIAAVITYERNTWSNKTGEVIQPSEIKALRK